MLYAAGFLIAALPVLAQAPAGRWDGTVRVDQLKVPFRIDFEGAKAALINGEARTESTAGGFWNGKMRFEFGSKGAVLEAVLTEGALTGTITSPRLGGALPFTAGAFCTCGFEGEAGPDISGKWQLDNRVALDIQRKEEDTFVTVHRPDGDIGPLAGRFDGAVFTLRYFDGARAVMAELEPPSKGPIDGFTVTWMEPGSEPKKWKATRGPLK